MTAIQSANGHGSKFTVTTGSVGINGTGLLQITQSADSDRGNTSVTYAGNFTSSLLSVTSSFGDGEEDIWVLFATGSTSGSTVGNFLAAVTSSNGHNTKFIVSQPKAKTESMTTEAPQPLVASNNIT